MFGILTLQQDILIRHRHFQIHYAQAVQLTIVVMHRTRHVVIQL